MLAVAIRVRVSATGKSRSESDKEQRKPEQWDNKSNLIWGQFFKSICKNIQWSSSVGQSFSSRIQARKSCRDGNEWRRAQTQYGFYSSFMLHSDKRSMFKLPQDLSFLQFFFIQVLTEYIVQDLNVNPKLPFEDNSFDVITNVVCFLLWTRTTHESFSSKLPITRRNVIHPAGQCWLLNKASNRFQGNESSS